MLYNIAAILFAYLVGSLSSAIIICKIMKLPDPRTTGSNNPGATNVLRIGGKKAAIIALLGDMLKGLIPVLVARCFGIDGFMLALVALVACLGHLFPVFFKFQGGKGVATGFGAIVALSWPVGLIMLGIWAVVAGIFRFSSLAAIIAFLLSPLLMNYFSNPNYVIPIAVLTLLILMRHKDNIQRLMKGQESKIGKK